MDRLTAARWRFPSRPNVLYARSGEVLRAGCVYVTSAQDRLVFSATGTLGLASTSTTFNVDHLLESAARWYRSGVIGVVLSGLGTDGTKGLRAITEVDGVRVVQSPYDAVFPSMPTNALIGDDVQYAVMLDHMGRLLTDLAADPDAMGVIAPDVQAEVAMLVPAAEGDLSRSLDRSIEDVLRVIREDLVLNIALVTTSSGEIIPGDSASGPDDTRGPTAFHSRLQSTDHLHEGDAPLPAIVPDASTQRSTLDAPVLPRTIGTYMTTPVWHQDGTLYGMLCCFNASLSTELNRRQYQRLQISARQIARLVNEAGEK